MLPPQTLGSIQNIVSGFYKSLLGKELIEKLEYSPLSSWEIIYDVIKNKILFYSTKGNKSHVSIKQ